MTGAERQAALRKRRKKKGLVRFETWIPKEKIEQLKNFVTKLIGEK